MPIATQPTESHRKSWQVSCFCWTDKHRKDFKSLLEPGRRYVRMLPFQPSFGLQPASSPFSLSLWVVSYEYHRLISSTHIFLIYNFSYHLIHVDLQFNPIPFPMRYLLMVISMGLGMLIRWRVAIDRSFSPSLPIPNLFSFTD